VKKSFGIVRDRTGEAGFNVASHCRAERRDFCSHAGGYGFPCEYRKIFRFRNRIGHSSPRSRSL
jgi:hypothetical protein